MSRWMIAVAIAVASIGALRPSPTLADRHCTGTSSTRSGGGEVGANAGQECPPDPDPDDDPPPGRVCTRRAGTCVEGSLMYTYSRPSSRQGVSPGATRPDS
jgi:hypothetical protein